MTLDQRGADRCVAASAASCLKAVSRDVRPTSDAEINGFIAARSACTARSCRFAPHSVNTAASSSSAAEAATIRMITRRPASRRMASVASLRSNGAAFGPANSAAS